MTKSDDSIIGFYASINIDDKETNAIRNYIWGENGLDNKLKSLKSSSYGNDFQLILFEFYVNPIPYEKANIKDIESYRPKEKSIGIPIILEEDNFFKLDEAKRLIFIQESILNKLDLLKTKVMRNKLDLDITKLKNDVIKSFENNNEI